MTVRDNMLLLEERVKKAVAYINKLKKDNEALKKEIEVLERDLNLVTSHNQELQSYVDNYKEDEKAIEASIESSLESLNDVGLDNLNLSLDDLEAAEEFSAIGGDIMDIPDISDDLADIEL